MDIIIQTSQFINIRISNNVNQFTAEKRFDRGLTIAELKGRLELISGASPASMKLEVFDEGDKLVCNIENDEALLGSLNIEENYRIHVTDLSNKSAEFEDFATVKKFELSNEEYSKKTDTVRSFLVKNKLGKYNEEEMARITEEKAKADKEEEETATTINVGDRCEVQVPNEVTRRGAVMYVGKAHFKPGWWVGVKYDEPLGKNDGSVGGKKYFEAPMKYGGFVKPGHVHTGDFPEIGIEDMDEM